MTMVKNLLNLAVGVAGRLKSWLGLKNQKVGCKSRPTFEDQLFFVKKSWLQITSNLRGPTFFDVPKNVKN